MAHGKELKTALALGIDNHTKDVDPGQNIVKINYELGDEALLWDEFNLNVYQLDLELKSGKKNDQASVDFGLREFKVDGTRFAINGWPFLFARNA